MIEADLQVDYQPKADIPCRLVDCSWGQLWLVSQRNSQPNFALRILQFRARFARQFFFASLLGACFQATGLYVSADDWKRERATCRAWDPFLERPGNLTGPKSYFEIKISWKVGCLLTSNEVHIVSLADNFTVQLSNLLKLPSGMESRTA